MSSTFVQVAGGVGRKVLVATVLGLIGLVVGVGSVLLPPAIPFGIVGIVGLLLLWVMPELQRLPYTWARRMVPVVLFVFTCVPNYYAIVLPDLPWIQIRRVAQIAWLIPLVILIAGSVGARERIRRVMLASPWLAVLTLGFMAITVITIPTAVYLSLSIGYVLNCYLNWFIPMFGVILLVRDKDAVVILFKVGLAAVAVNLVVGAIEFHLQRPFLIYALPESMRARIFADNSIAADIFVAGQGQRDGTYRASSTYTTALSWGENCAMFLSFGLHLLAHGRRPSEKWIGLIGTVMCALSIALSGSRGAYVGMITSAVCFSICWSFRSSILNKGSLAGKIGLVLFAMASTATLLAVMFVGRVHRAVLGGGGQGQMSTDTRLAQWTLAKPKILSRPIFGWGGGSAGDIIHYPTSHGGFTVDGYYMNLLVDYGIPGCALFFACFLLAATICLYHYITSADNNINFGNALGASLLAFAVYRTTLSQNDSLTIAFMLIGLVFVFAYLAAGKRVSLTGRRNRSAVSVL